MSRIYWTDLIYAPICRHLIGESSYLSGRREMHQREKLDWTIFKKFVLININDKLIKRGPLLDKDFWPPLHFCPMNAQEPKFNLYFEKLHLIVINLKIGIKSLKSYR